MSYQILPGTNGTVNIPLSELIRLDDLGIPGAKDAYGTRPLNKQHISRLVQSGGDHWPAMEVVRLIRRGILRGELFGQEQQLYGVIDGLHRWEAAKKLELPYVFAVVGTYKNDKEIIKAVLMANLSHGISANNITRKMLAGRLIDEGMGIENICNMTGLSKATINILIKTAEGTSTPGRARPTDAQKLVAFFKRFFKERMDSENFDREQDNEMLAQELLSYLSDLPTEAKLYEAMEAIDNMYNVLVTVEELTK